VPRKYSPAKRYQNKGGKKKAAVLTWAEDKKLRFYVREFTRSPERNQLIICLLFAAGFRITEVARIRIKDILYPTGEIKAEPVIPAKFTKNGKAGHVFFYNKKLVDALKVYLQLRIDKKHWMGEKPDKYLGLEPNSPLILTEKKSGFALKGRSYTKVDGTVAEYLHADSLQELVSAWFPQAGIAGGTSHSGRRTFATRLSNHGVSEGMLCALLRHDTEDMPYGYIELTPAQIKKYLDMPYEAEKAREKAKAKAK